MTDSKSPIQVVGRDSRGRRVYLYSAGHMVMANAAKFSRLKAFGASTLRCSHISIAGNMLSFDFIGKKGIRVNKILKDNFLARNIARQCSNSLDNQIFKTTDDEVRSYLKSISEDSGFTVKGIRNYLGKLTAFRKIKTVPVPRNGRELKRYKKEVGKTVANETGEFPYDSLKLLRFPEVFCVWEANSPSPDKKAATKYRSVTNEFLECIHYDQNIAMGESIDSNPHDQNED